MKLICIKCPRGCEITIDGEKITGNSCPRGLDYAKEEQTCPMRTVTYLAKSKGYVVPVKTDRDVPKSKITEVVDEIAKLELKDTKIGDIVIQNVLGLGANVVVTGDRYHE